VAIRVRDYKKLRNLTEQFFANFLKKVGIFGRNDAFLNDLDDFFVYRQLYAITIVAYFLQFF